MMAGFEERYVLLSTTFRFPLNFLHVIRAGKGPNGALVLPFSDNRRILIKKTFGSLIDARANR